MIPFKARVSLERCSWFRSTFVKHQQQQQYQQRQHRFVAADRKHVRVHRSRQSGKHEKVFTLFFKNNWKCLVSNFNLLMNLTELKVKLKFKDNNQVFVEQFCQLN